MIDSRIKNLLIDFGGVLVDLDMQRCIDRFKELGCNDLDQLLNMYHQADFLMSYEKGLITSEEFRKDIRSMIRHTVSDEQIDSAWNSFLVGVPTYKLELLLQLRQKYNVFLLSNTNELHWEWSCRNAFSYQKHQVEDFFDRIYLSFEMKMAKPDPSIFKAVLEDASINPEETFFIDDSSANCSTAQALGISTYTPQAGENWSHLFDVNR